LPRLLLTLGILLAELPLASLSVGGRQLFWLLLHRAQCYEDPHWKDRADGKAWDSVKSLVHNGFPLKRTFQVEDQGFKAAPGEKDNMLLLPRWEECVGMVGAAVEP
jgi:hypothetical protein